MVNVGYVLVEPTLATDVSEWIEAEKNRILTSNPNGDSHEETTAETAQ